MSFKPYQQQQLDSIKKRQLNQLTQCPKSFFQLMSFMQENLRKQFKSFSIFNLCHGSSYKLRFNDIAFEKAFGSMMISERLDFYQRAVLFGIQAFGKDKKTKQALDEAIDKEVREVLPQGFKEMTLMVHQGFRSSEQVRVKVEKFKISSRNHFHINLQNYILRESKKRSHPQNYVLEAINNSHPLRVKFSFVDLESEKQNYEIIKKLSQLAFRSTVNSMILPEYGRSPVKTERRHSVRKSMGRLAEHLVTEEEEFRPVEQVKETQNQAIFGGKQVLEFSRLLAEKRKQRGKPYPEENSDIVDELLSSSRSQQGQSSKRPKQQKQSQNIFQKVLQTQSDIKLPYKNYNNNNTLSKADTSPIHRFTSSQVKQYTPPGTKPYQPRYKNVFQLMLREFNLRQLQQSLSTKTFKQIYISPSITILQHTLRPQRFQCRLLLQNISIDKIYSLLINQQMLKKWNSCVDESQIKITLSAENCLVCYQKHKRYSTWFKERDYLFLRHVFVYKEGKYIADRSIQHNSFMPFQAIQRGYVRHMVTRLRQVNERKVQLVVDMSVDHGGYLGVDKKKQLNLNYLKQYEKLQFFVDQQQSLLTKIISYCNLQWNIDWIDEINEGSFPRSLTLKTQDFIQGSQIDQIGIDNVELQSQDFYSIQDQDELQQQQTQPSNMKIQNNKEFKFQTTQGFEQARPKQLSKNVPQNQLVQQKQIFSQSRQNQQQSFYGQMKTADPQIVLDDEGYCILPEKYYKKKHPTIPKQNYQQKRQKLFDNIVMKGDFVQNKDGGILLVDKAKIDAQNNVINFIMKTMRKNLLTGKSILSISLPVQIFKQDSNTQRLCQSMAMGPYFLQKATKTNYPLQRMKLSICFALSNSLMYFYIQKPFNPILGQTYQGMINGCPIYAQQISHHPPITSLYFVGRGFRVYANIQAKVSLHLNSGDGINQGFYTIEFDDGHAIRFQTAPGELSGFTIGDRKYRFKDKMYVYDRKNSYFGVINFEDPNSGFFSKSKWQYPDQMQGQILKVTSSFITKFEQSQEKLIPKAKYIVSTQSRITGRWLHYLHFDGKQYYNIENDIPYKLVNYEYALNSDARYREDLIYRTRNDLAKSQIYKENLENKQRREKKLREQYQGKAH